VPKISNLLLNFPKWRRGFGLKFGILDQNFSRREFSGATGFIGSMVKGYSTDRLPVLVSAAATPTLTTPVEYC